MKKLFLLIPALVLSLITNAAVININTGTADALRKALNSASDGDIIEMAAGTYVESNENFIAFTGKNITVRAAEGEDVIIQPQVPITVANGGCAHFQNVKIDASRLHELASWYEHVIYATDAAANNRIILEGCEIYGFALNKSLISCPSASALDELTINNCYFHNINKSCVFIENTSNSIAISITNSTFANITTDAGSYYAGVIDTRATSGSFLVDHCTFYNVEAMNTDYAAIGQVKLTSGATVSNCIFALSAPGASSNRTIRDVVAANNCLVYNYSTDGGYGMQSNVTKTGCFIADPLFADAANGDFSLAGDWTTMSLSPARGAATDDSDLGDPRWYSAEVLPETDFDPLYVFLGEKAMLSGSFALNGDNYIQSQNTTADGLAIWKIQAESKCVVEVTLNIAAANTSGHRYEVALFDSDNNPVGTALAEPSNSWSAGNKVLGSFEIPAAGNYTIKLTNDCDYSSTILEGITLSYAGGAVVPVSPTVNTTLNIEDALFLGCSRDAIGIAYPSSGTSSAWIKWNISTSATAFYDITVNINTAYAHGFTVAVYEDENAEPIASVTEGSYINTTGDGLALELGNINLVGGKNYVVKVTNAPSGSQAKVLNVTFAPVASSSAITLPNTLEFNDAILFGTAFVNEDKLYFAEHGKEGHIHEDITGAWAVWNVTVETAGTFLFTLNASSTNGQSYKISIMDGETEIDSYLKNPGEGEVEMKHYFYLEPGNYSVKVQNKTQWSHGYLTGLVVTQPDDIIVLSENATDNSAWLDKFNDGNSYKVQIMRSFTGGMYNTICLPIYVSGSEARKVFGDDVVLKVLDGANLDDTESILELNFKNSSDIWQGTPHLIKPSKNIVNPVFENVQFKASAPSPTTKDQADFVGTFVASNIPAGEENLFLGRNDLLYFNKSAATPVGGFRAWFVLHDIPDGPHFIKGARIVERENTATGMENVDQLPKANSQKLIENGQLIIIRDGVRYNVMGVRVE